jgi:hypothetical protein
MDVAAVTSYQMNGFTLNPGAILVVVAGPQIITIDLSQAISAKIKHSSTNLPDFHRFNLEQCMVWDYERQVREVLSRLQTMLRGGRTFEALSPESYWRTEQASNGVG